MDHLHSLETQSEDLWTKLDVTLDIGLVSHCMALRNSTTPIIVGGGSSIQKNHNEGTTLIDLDGKRLEEGPVLNVGRSYHR